MHGNDFSPPDSSERLLRSTHLKAIGVISVNRFAQALHCHGERSIPFRFDLSKLKLFFLAHHFLKEGRLEQALPQQIQHQIEIRSHRADGNSEGVVPDRTSDSSAH